MCFPGALQPITSQNLQAVSNSPASSTALYYSIEQAPRLGRLITSQGEEIRNFTQAQVRFQFLQHPRTLNTALHHPFPQHGGPSLSPVPPPQAPDPRQEAARRSSRAVSFPALPTAAKRD